MSRSDKCDVPLCPRVNKGLRLVFGGKILKLCWRHYNWLKESLEADGRPSITEGRVMGDVTDDYEVSLHNTFEATSAEDAVRQMVAWLSEPGVVGTTAYRVRTETTDLGIYDAEKL